MPSSVPLLDRNVQSSKMVHAALLLLMLEAVTHGPRFTISLKRSTQNLQLSTSCRPITSSIGGASSVDATYALNLSAHAFARASSDLIESHLGFDLETVGSQPDR